MQNITDMRLLQVSAPNFIDPFLTELILIYFAARVEGHLERCLLCVYINICHVLHVSCYTRPPKNARSVHRHQNECFINFVPCLYFLCRECWYHVVKLFPFNNNYLIRENSH